MLNGGKGKKGIAVAAIFFLIWMSAGQDVRTAPTPLRTAVGRNLSDALADAVYSRFLPTAVRTYKGDGGQCFAVRRVEGILPLYGMARRGMADGGNGAGAGTNAGTDAGMGAGTGADAGAGHGHAVFLEYGKLENEGTGRREDFTAEEGIPQERDLQELLREENEAAAAAAGENGPLDDPTRHDFTPNDRRMLVDLEELRDYDTLVRTFYTVDASTFAGSDQLNVDSLLSRDMTVSGAGDGPQILIYHTHSQEAFVDSVPGDDSTTIMGVGEHLAQILQSEYGYRVLHHTGQYDVETREDAYGRTLPVLERILEENPSIEVVIDLHRDQMPEETRLVMELDGRPTARFMFFNGLSRTKKTGDIAYLKNENLADNLAFSFQMQLKAQEYYPGLTRKIYLKGYRYNMHLRPRSMLVELGAQNNTVEEAMNACDPLAHLLDMVLSGEG